MARVWWPLVFYLLCEGFLLVSCRPQSEATTPTSVAVRRNTATSVAAGGGVRCRHCHPESSGHIGREHWTHSTGRALITRRVDRAPRSLTSRARSRSFVTDKHLSRLQDKSSENLKPHWNRSARKVSLHQSDSSFGVLAPDLLNVRARWASLGMRSPHIFVDRQELQGVGSQLTTTPPTQIDETKPANRELIRFNRTDFGAASTSSGHKIPDNRKLQKSTPIPVSSRNRVGLRDVVEHHHSGRHTADLARALHKLEETVRDIDRQSHSLGWTFPREKPGRFSDSGTAHTLTSTAKPMTNIRNGTMSFTSNNILGPRWNTGQKPAVLSRSSERLSTEDTHGHLSKIPGLIDDRENALLRRKVPEYERTTLDNLFKTIQDPLTDVRQDNDDLTSLLNVGIEQPDSDSAEEASAGDDINNISTSNTSSTSTEPGLIAALSESDDLAFKQTTSSTEKAILSTFSSPSLNEVSTQETRTARTQTTTEQLVKLVGDSVTEETNSVSTGTSSQKPTVQRDGTASSTVQPPTLLEDASETREINATNFINFAATKNNEELDGFEETEDKQDVFLDSYTNELDGTNIENILDETNVDAIISDNLTGLEREDSLDDKISSDYSDEEGTDENDPNETLTQIDDEVAESPAETSLSSEKPNETDLSIEDRTLDANQMEQLFRGKLQDVSQLSDTEVDGDYQASDFQDTLPDNDSPNDYSPAADQDETLPFEYDYDGPNAEDTYDEAALDEDPEETQVTVATPPSSRISLDAFLLAVLSEKLQGSGDVARSLSDSVSRLLDDTEIIGYRFGNHNISVNVTNIQVTGGESLKMLNASSNLDDLQINFTLRFSIRLTARYDAAGSVSNLQRRLTKFLLFNYPRQANGSLQAFINNATVGCHLDLQHSTNDRKLSIESLQLMPALPEPVVRLTGLARLPRTLAKLRFREQFPRAVSQVVKRKLSWRIEPVMKNKLWQAISASLDSLPMDTVGIDQALASYLPEPLAGSSYIPTLSPSQLHDLASR